MLICIVKGPEALHCTLVSPPGSFNRAKLASGLSARAIVPSPAPIHASITPQITAIYVVVLIVVSFQALGGLGSRSSSIGYLSTIEQQKKTPRAGLSFLSFYVQTSSHHEA
jgi:hypothetical protein